MPRRSILREVQEEAYAPRRKPSPGPLILSLLLPLLLIPALLPIVDLIASSPPPAKLDIDLGTPPHSIPDLTLTVMPDGMISQGWPAAPFHHENLPSVIAVQPIESPKILLIVDGAADTGLLIPILQTLESCNIAEIIFSSEKLPKPLTPTPS